jgi:hypothetical protein
MTCDILNGSIYLQAKLVHLAILVAMCGPLHLSTWPSVLHSSLRSPFSSRLLRAESLDRSAELASAFYIKLP